jgi:xanthine dehydrogenase accessory factor
MDWLGEAQALAAAGEAFALATVVHRVAPASAQPGAKAVIRADGAMRGWVGGSCAQPVVVAEAQRALREGMPRLLRLGHLPGASEADDVVEYPMTCHSGGALEILIEPVLPMPRIWLVGATPVMDALAALANVVGYRVERVEDAAGLLEVLDDGPSPAYVVIATMGVDDEAAVAAALRAGTAYVALVASPTRAAVVRQTLAEMGVAPEAVARLRAPAGLDIGARTQEEIALSIMAEIAQRRAAMTARTEAAPAEVAAGPESALTATDPVCGMTVTIAGARHVSELDGKTWYFCCGGCKARFEADPSPYLAA